jgi:hypothetical protein
MPWHRNPSETRVSPGRKVIDKGFVPCTETICTGTLLYEDPLLRVIFVQQHVIPEIRAFISRRAAE